MMPNSTSDCSSTAFASTGSSPSPRRYRDPVEFRRTRDKGYDAHEIVGRHFSIFYTAADIAAGGPELALQQAAATGHFEDTVTRVRKDGGVFSANGFGTPILARDGTVLGFGEITRDITDRVAAADRLTSSEARLQTLVNTVLDTLVDGLIVIDRMGRVQVYNRACEKLFGYQAAEVVGHNVKMLMPPNTKREHNQYLRNYQTSGIRKIIGISREVVGQRKDRSTFPMHLAVGEATHLGQPLCVGIIRDLTERNQVESQLRQSQKMEAVGQLIGGLAHVFNNILMLISINVEALLEEEAPTRTRERLEQIEKSAARAAELTQQLLAYSRRQPLRPRPTDLNELVLATSKLLRRTLGEDVDRVDPRRRPVDHQCRSDAARDLASEPEPQSTRCNAERRKAADRDPQHRAGSGLCFPESRRHELAQMIRQALDDRGMSPSVA